MVFLGFVSESPVSAAEYRFTAAVGEDAVDIHIRGTDHKVHMYEAVIQSFLLQFFLAHRLAAFEAKRVSFADGEMVGGILIEQGVIENQSLSAKSATMGHQRDFTETTGAFIGLDQAFQGFVTIIRRKSVILPSLNVS